MQYLQRQSKKGDTALYSVEGEFAGNVNRYVVSTMEGRRLVNQPELLGVAFGKAMTRAVTRALAVLPEREAIEMWPQERVCVVHFLRGGLNFGLRDALHDAYGFNRHSSCFMSSQRRKVDGRWQVEEDMYRKLKIPDHAVLLVGDVVATGVTVGNGLQVILEHLKKIGSSVKRIVFFTVGCHKLEKVLEEADRAYSEAFDEYEGTTAVYLEGKFRLVDSKTELRIGHPGTDLIRRDCLLAPEFALSQYDRLSFPLERCSIYDAGSRAFDIPTYVQDVRGYWSQVAELAAGGMTLEQALDERWPEPWRDDRQAFVEAMEAQWKGVEHELLGKLWQRVQARWTDEFRKRAGRPQALAEIAEQRLRAIPNVTREVRA